jgi:hypothetical protein
MKIEIRKTNGEVLRFTINATEISSNWLFGFMTYLKLRASRESRQSQIQTHSKQAFAKMQQKHDHK